MCGGCVGVAQQTCEVRAGVVVGAECWRMHCVTFGVVECFIFRGIGCGLPVGFRWSVGVLLRVGLSEEQGGAGVGGVRLLPSGVASGPLNT